MKYVCLILESEQFWSFNYKFIFFSRYRTIYYSLSISSCVHFGSLGVSRNFSISFMLSNFLAYSCSDLPLCLSMSVRSVVIAFILFHIFVISVLLFFFINFINLFKEPYFYFTDFLYISVFYFTDSVLIMSFPLLTKLLFSSFLM